MICFVDAVGDKIDRNIILFNCQQKKIGAKAGQVEMCKRLDSEVFQLRRDLEAAVSEKSSCIAKMKKESQKVVLDMKQEVEELHKLNTK